MIRLYYSILGSEGFKKGLRLYFERHDGQVSNHRLREYRSRRFYNIHFFCYILHIVRYIIDNTSDHTKRHYGYYVIKLNESRHMIHIMRYLSLSVSL